VEAILVEAGIVVHLIGVMEVVVVLIILVSTRIIHQEYKLVMV